MSRLIFSAMLPITTRANTPMVMPKMVRKALIFLRNMFLKILIASLRLAACLSAMCLARGAPANQAGGESCVCLGGGSCTWPDGGVLDGALRRAQEREEQEWPTPGRGPGARRGEIIAAAGDDAELGSRPPAAAIRR